MKELNEIETKALTAVNAAINDEGDGTEVVIVAVMPFSTYVEKL